MHVRKTIVQIQGTFPNMELFYLRNRSALAVSCCVLIHCLEVRCKEDQITSVQPE